MLDKIIESAIMFKFGIFDKTCSLNSKGGDVKYGRRKLRSHPYYLEHFLIRPRRQPIQNGGPKNLAPEKESIRHLRMKIEGRRASKITKIIKRTPGKFKNHVCVVSPLSRLNISEGRFYL